MVSNWNRPGGRLSTSHQVKPRLLVLVYIRMYNSHLSDNQALQGTFHKAKSRYALHVGVSIAKQNLPFKRLYENLQQCHSTISALNNTYSSALDTTISDDKAELFST